MKLELVIVLFFCALVSAVYQYLMGRLIIWMKSSWGEWLVFVVQYALAITWFVVYIRLVVYSVSPIIDYMAESGVSLNYRNIAVVAGFFVIGFPYAPFLSYMMKRHKSDGAT